MKRILVCICFITTGCFPVSGQDWYLDGKVKVRVEEIDNGYWVRAGSGDEMFVPYRRMYRKPLTAREQ